SYLVHGELWLVMEHMDGGTLRGVIDESQMSEDDIAAVSREVRDPTCTSQGLGRIVWERGSEPEPFHVPGFVSVLLVCSDFGLSAQLSPEQSRWSSVTGTPSWTAPEVMTGQPYGTKADIWCFGIVGIEMVDREVAYRNESPHSAQLLTASEGIPQLQQPKLLSPLLRDFLSCCLQADEARRCSAQELLQHQFVSSAKPAYSLVPLIISVKKGKEDTR
ncbi:PAK1 kinase, partial [Sylvietta virens]|nr:PAK1 kinase [Sylvietta virens]